MDKYIKGYKAVYKYNWLCSDLTLREKTLYKLIPATYFDEKLKKEVQYPIKVNVLGFHYCINPDDVVYYYDIHRADFELYEVHDFCEIDIKLRSDNDSVASDNLMVVRKIPKNEYKKVFNKPHVELVGRSRIYVWHNKMYSNISRMISKTLIFSRKHYEK